MKNPPKYSVPALEKSLDILEVFARERRQLTLSELAQLLRRNSSEIFRMVSCLTRRGYLTRDEASGSYRLSLRLFELAHTNSPVQEMIRSSQDAMRRLAGQIKESCHLSILSDEDLVVLAQAETRQPVRIVIEPGSRFPAARTASGKLLLAHLDSEARVRLRKACKGKFPGVEALEAIRQDGFCLDVDETRRGVMDLAVLAGRPPFAACALAISSLRMESPDTFLRRMLPALRKAARAITREAGFYL